MIRSTDRQRARSLEHNIVEFANRDTPLPGIDQAPSRKIYIAQLIESIRRIEYVDRLKQRPLSADCANPHSEAFNPVKGAIFHTQHGSRDEAYWLVFLLTHFGKHESQGWALLKAVYGRLGKRPIWSWDEISTNIALFRVWLRQNQNELKDLTFGNHRKYESKREDSKRGLANVFETYVDWVSPPRNHDAKIDSVIQGINNSETAFDKLFEDADEILSWGRLAKFDHLTMLSKIGIVEITPGNTYLAKATGPKKGAALLLHGRSDHRLDVKCAETILCRLGQKLGVGQQELEDSLCNWQKSPNRFVPFR